MSEAMSEQPPSESHNESTIREDLVNTAVKFLENPNVIKTSLAEQQRFLRRKGLSDEEIRLACERSGAYTYHEHRNRAPPPLPVSTNTYGNPGALQISLFDRIREIAHNVTIFSFLAYIVYKFYEKFIAPFLFGKKKKTVEESLEELDKTMKQSVNELQSNLTSVKIEVDKISQGGESGTQRQLSDLKSEIATVKGLLLSRNQFPPVSKSSVVRPSIPAWQKTSISQDSDPESDPESRKAEDLSEVGSGSGSSEHEHNTKNSDSSLDIISFSSKDSDFRRHKHKEEEDDDKN